MPTCKSTCKKPRCRIAEIMCHQVARRCKKLRHALPHRPESGEVRDHHRCKGSGCWASQLATRSSSRLNFGPPPISTEFWLKGFLWCGISKVLGCSSSSAPTLARLIPSAEFRQLRQSSLPPLTIQPRGNVSPSFGDFWSCRGGA